MVNEVEEEYKLAGNTAVIANVTIGNLGYERDVASWSRFYYTNGIPQYHTKGYACCPGWLRGWDVAELLSLKEHRRINQSLRDRYLHIRNIKAKAVWDQDDMDLINGLMMLDMNLIPPGNLLTLLTNGVIGDTPEEVRRFLFAASQDKGWSPEHRSWALDLWKNIHWFKGRVYITKSYPQHVVLPSKQQIVKISKELGTFKPKSMDTAIEDIRDLLYRIDLTDDKQSRERLKRAVKKWRQQGFPENLG